MVGELTLIRTEFTAPAGPADTVGLMQPITQTNPGTPLTWSISVVGVASRLFAPKVELRASVVSGVLLALGYLLHVMLKLPWAEGFIWASLAIGMVYGGRAALASLRHRKFDIDVLMVVGAGLAAGTRHPEEGALLLFLFVLAGALEDLAMARTKREVEALHKLMPTEALVLRDGAWIEAAAETLAAGEHVRIRPGERVPADAVVLEGASSMDQSAITGESMPREVNPGDELFAGTINTDDPLVARVLRPVKESSLQKILDLVTRAREQREPVQRAIDKFSEPYALAVMGVSIVVFVVWWLGLAHRWTDAAYTAITLLIVASPCALVIATPTATLAAIARAARGGVLFKGGQSIEQLARTAAVAFDKTGTLTFGRPHLYEVHPVAWSDGRELLAIAAGLEADSTHPIGAAIREAASLRAVAPIAMSDINHVTARGIEGRLGGQLVRLGSYAFTEAVIPVCFRNRVREVLERIQERGHVAVVAAKSPAQSPPSDSGDAAVLIMADAVRPGAATLVQELHALAIKPVAMLTGDNRLTAARIADSLNLDSFEAELLPQGKLDAVAKLKAGAHERATGNRGVAVIGDGVNDAPALAAADVAVGIGTIGTAAALESSDVVLLSDNLAAIPWAIRLARRARRTIQLNMAFAVGVILLMALFTLASPLTGYQVPLWQGVLAHEGGTLLVVANSLLLLGYHAPSRIRETSARRGSAASGGPVSARASAA